MAIISNNKKSKRFLSKLQAEGVPIKTLTHLLLGINTDALHDHWVKTYVHECEHRGRNQAIKHMKLLYTQAVQYSLYQKIPFVPFRKRYSDNMLRTLSPFRPLLRCNVPETRAALTVLRQFEMLYTEPSYDISTVTEPCNINRWSMVRFKSWLYRRRRLPTIRIGAPKDHVTSKKGPSRLPALSSWKQDLLSVPGNILESIKTLGTITGDLELPDRLTQLTELLIQEEEVSDSESHSRIQVFSAGGGKTRVIAIVDYWTQRALKPLHQAIFSNLRKISEDATFGHESAADWLKTVPKGVDIYSYDLTAATDRIPYEVHHSVLRSHLPRNQRDIIPGLVKTLLLDRDFDLSWNEASVRYACGQPMGAYASWALLAYSHHCIARFCGAERHQYRIIGDDIVILGKAGRRYRKFMESIGVTISEGKSIISQRDSKHQTGEVAKRLVRDGIEISPPTAKLIFESYQDWRLAPMLLNDIVRRGWDLQEGPLVGYLSSTYSKSWYDKVISVLTYPFGDDLTALKLRGRLESLSPWAKYDQRELADISVRYRIALLNRTAALLYKGINPYMIMAGAPPTGENVNAAIYALSPERTVRTDMCRSMFSTISTIDDALFYIKSEDDFEKYVPAIRDEELYAPDITLQFLEKKYQRAHVLSNILLDMKKRIDSGTLQDFLLKREIPSNLDPRLVRGSITATMGQ